MANLESSTHGSRVGRNLTMFAPVICSNKAWKCKNVQPLDSVKTKHGFHNISKVLFKLVDHLYSSMHLIEPIRSCIDEIIRTTGSGLKSMILDEFTTGVISAGYAKSDMLLREVYLFEYIDTIFESTERLNHMKCIAILRPTKDNIELLCRELRRPHYRTYHLYFTCRIGTTIIEKLGEADETEVVRCVRELPIDFQPITPFIFTLQSANKTFDLSNNNWHAEGFKRVSDGLASAMIALRMNPIIRFQTQSLLCRSLAEEVGQVLKNEAKMNKSWRQSAPFDVNSLLLIIDRRSDLITPIVNKWTYYSMIHELFDIKNNRISLVDVPNRQPKDPKEMLVFIENDEFFDENYYKNYGELGTTLKLAIETLKDTTKSQYKVETMEDMKRFIDEYPETKRYASNLHNHVFLMSEISRQVTEHLLIDISECEQELACGMSSNSEILKKLKQYVSSNLIRPIDAIRLVSLYTVCRPDRSSQLSELMKLLRTRKDITPEEVKFIEQLRQFTLTKPQNPLDETVQQVTRMIVQGVKGVENVLTQYKPNLAKIIDDLRRGNKLRESDFAFCGERYRDEAPKKIVVFFVGGMTFDEALIADQYNRSSSSGLQVVVGGTIVHNFKTFMKEVKACCGEV